MPEGDTIALIASRLAPVLEAREITRFEAPRLSGDLPGVGERVEAVQPQGKYLTISFSGGLSVQTHLGMVGSWHLYSHDETWQRPASQARLIVETSERVAVCFRVPTVRVFASGRHDPLSHLGPDLCLALVDIDTIVRRARELGDPAADIATIVLDQRIAAGIGNVFKSEVLFANGVDPRRRLNEVSQEHLAAIFMTAHHQLRANLGPGPRTTVPQGLAVYGRGGQRCWDCTTLVESARTGTPARMTYWCPRCQHR